ncbi:CocE/NonD family hydrolase [Schumannella luteola]|uniref:Xaa-Pro dipeptidyl-peptidase C-terminal domain-containing protein n=1 Tax=Schumannella luteola TaxID=472059 RepID=A0A852YCT7_9MICO|nr:CocE/NonD family hydrolase [Schumannella luteola]NYG97407.1 hypothetical protein [Schumannella luteola]TPX01652.1 CocE/NonD family hydrolase [Schumannella luteola]
MRTRRLIAPVAALALIASGALASAPALAQDAPTAGAQRTAPAGSPATASAAADAADTDPLPPAPVAPPVGEGVTSAENARVPAGASWTQHYFPSADDSGTQLHADVLVPEGLAADAKLTPIISVGPYFSHSGALAANEFTSAGPSARFQELITAGGMFDRGYALVLVDARNFGGSTGCQDGGGPGERADVKAAIEWAASQSWSTGRVGMYGKSYDAITGLIGNNLKLPELGAVVAQEPIWDLERNLASGGIPRATQVSIANFYSEAAGRVGLPDDDPYYQQMAAKTDPFCSVGYVDSMRSSDPAFWAERDFAERAKGTDTPILLTQGTTEWNTEAEGMAEFLENHRGIERGWIGPWDHKKGDDVAADGSLEMGRAGWFDEVFAFYDEHLKGVKPTTKVPAFAVQDSSGAWRGQKTWPVVDRTQTVTLDDGRYVDDGLAWHGKGRTGDRANSFSTWSEPVSAPTRITGTPSIDLRPDQHGNAYVRLYDVAPDGIATWFDEQASALRPGKTSIELRSTDWLLAKGHRLAVEIGTVAPAGGNLHLTNDWLDTPSGERIRITGAKLHLQFDDPADDVPTQGDPAFYLPGFVLLQSEKLSPQRADFRLDAPAKPERG